MSFKDLLLSILLSYVLIIQVEYYSLCVILKREQNEAEN